MAIIGKLIILAAGFGAILRGTVALRRGYVTTRFDSFVRDENPNGFWSMVIPLFMAGVMCVALFVYLVCRHGLW
jgi:hypothetical protein